MNNQILDKDLVPKPTDEMEAKVHGGCGAVGLQLLRSLGHWRSGPSHGSRGSIVAVQPDTEWTFACSVRVNAIGSSATPTDASPLATTYESTNGSPFSLL